MSNRGLVGLGIMIAFGGAYLFSLGLVEPVFSNTTIGAFQQLSMIFGCIIIIGGTILAVKNK